jgi:Ser/Thr protein kinase RdoA (MazF antagonist)
MDDSNARAALSIFRGSTTKFQVKPVSHLGFSGSSLWQVLADDSPPLCLKRWPASHPPPARLPWIHSVLEQVCRQGLNLVPEPQRTPTGNTTCELAGSTWELMTWLPGAADFVEKPSAARLQAAFRALARVHQALSACDLRHLPANRTTPALDDRITRWHTLQTGGLAQIAAAVHAQRIPALDDLAHHWLTLHPCLPAPALAQLIAANQQAWPQQPVLRDVWSDHVLFVGDEVTGFIDFGAMRVDTPLTDVARLLGSLAGSNQHQRHVALAAYGEVLPLSAADQSLIHLLDQTGNLLAGWNWLQWLYLERREFPSLPAVRQRLQHLLPTSHPRVNDLHLQ